MKGGVCMYLQNYHEELGKLDEIVFDLAKD